MIIIKRLFAEKILGYYEGAEKLIGILCRIPGIGVAIEKQIANKESGIIKHISGVMAQIMILLWALVKKMVFVLAFVMLPYHIISKSCPLIAENRNLTVIFLFFVICIVGGSITNNVVSVFNKRDYIMTRVVLISPAINSLGKIIYRMIIDFVCFAIILCIVKLPIHVSLLIATVNMCARPLGELVTILMYEKSRLLYNNRGAVYGTIMALSLIAGYGSLYIIRSVNSFWNVLYSPVFVIVMAVLGVLAFLVLCNYRNYDGIAKAAVVKM